MLEKRQACRFEPVAQHMNTEHVDVGPDFSDVGLAEIFIHHRVLIVPVTEHKRGRRRHHAIGLLRRPRAALHRRRMTFAAATGVADILVALFVVLLAAKLGDELFKRLGSPRWSARSSPA